MPSIRREPWEGSRTLPRRLRWAKPSSVNAISFGAWPAILAAAAFVGCSPSPDELYSRGMAAFKAGQGDAGTADLEGYVDKRCNGGAQQRCRHAYVTLGHTYEKRGATAKAWAAYDQALTFPPHATDEALTADRDRVRDALTSKQGEEAGRTPVIIRYRDEVTEDFTGRSVVVSLDFAPVLTKDKEVAELHSPDFRRIYSGSVAAGDHVLVVDLVHDCAPGAGRKCARSRIHRAWPFTSPPRTPTTLELRAFTEPEDGDSPAHPALELVSR